MTDILSPLLEVTQHFQPRIHRLSTGSVSTDFSIQPVLPELLEL
ncbi:MAG: hypothetical protein ACK5Q5_16555 [Planctomycetaceae bacterium]